MAGELNLLTARHPYAGWMIVYLCLRTSGSEASRLLVVPDPQCAICIIGRRNATWKISLFHGLLLTRQSIVLFKSILSVKLKLHMTTNTKYYNLLSVGFLVIWFVWLLNKGEERRKKHVLAWLILSIIQRLLLTHKKTGAIIFRFRVPFLLWRFFFLHNPDAVYGCIEIRKKQNSTIFDCFQMKSVCSTCQVRLNYTSVLNYIYYNLHQIIYMRMILTC
jgi:hypothetical protein